MLVSNICTARFPKFSYSNILEVLSFLPIQNINRITLPFTTQRFALLCLKLQIMDGVKLVKRRDAEPTNGVVEGLEEMAETHDLEVDLGSGAKLTASAAEETVSLKLAGESAQVEGKSKRKKNSKSI